LSNQLSVRTLSLDETNNAGLIPIAIATNEPVREVRVSGGISCFRFLNSMLLDEHPVVSTINESLYKSICDIGMVWQCHFRRGESLYPGHCLSAKDGGEMVLPRLNVEPKILHRG
jgi:hypothetical protein